MSLSDDDVREIRPTAFEFQQWLASLPSNEHREKALEILWDIVCPECGSVDGPAPCDCIGYQAKAEINAEAMLHWALDIIDRQAARLIQLGDPEHLVRSATHLRGKDLARKALKDLANFSGCCHVGDSEPASNRRSAFVAGGLQTTRPATVRKLVKRADREDVK